MDNLFILAHKLSRFITWSMYKEREEKQSMPRNHKGNTRKEHIYLHMLIAKCTPGKKGDTCNMEH